MPIATIINKATKIPSEISWDKEKNRRKIGDIKTSLITCHNPPNMVGIAMIIEKFSLKTSRKLLNDFFKSIFLF